MSGRTMFLTGSAVALSLAVLGGASQRASGPGSQPGLFLVHAAATVFCCTLVAAVSSALCGGRGQRVFILASDGVKTIPVTGPYPSESAARDQLDDIRERFDPQSQYLWDIGSTSDTSVVGLCGQHL